MPAEMTKWNGFTLMDGALLPLSTNHDLLGETGKSQHQDGAVKGRTRKD